MEIGDIPVIEKSPQKESQIKVYRNQNFDHLYPILANLSLLKYLYFGARYELIFPKTDCCCKSMWPNFILPKMPVHEMNSSLMWEGFIFVQFSGQNKRVQKKKKHHTTGHWIGYPRALISEKVTFESCGGFNWSCSGDECRSLRCEMFQYNSDEPTQFFD